MRIAFVSQVFDRVAGSGCNSVGLVTRHLAGELAREHRVTVFAVGSGTAEQAGGAREHGVAGAAGAASRDGLGGGAGPVGGAGLGGGAGLELRLLRPSVRDAVADRLWGPAARLAGAARPAGPPARSTSAVLGRAYVRAVARALAAEQVDVVHLQHATQFLPVLRQAAPGAALVLHLHARWFAQTPVPVLARRLAHADVVVAVSDHVRDAVVATVPALAGRCVTVHNGVDASRFAEVPPLAPPAAVSQAAPSWAAGEVGIGEVGIGDRRRGDGEVGCGGRGRGDGEVGDDGGARGDAARPPRVLYVGALSPHKGVHDAVAAFALLARHDPAIELHVVGPPGVYPVEESFDRSDPRLAAVGPLYRGDYGRRLRDIAGPGLARRVSLVGGLPAESDALLRELGDADVVVFPPVWDEAFGLPALEAMAAGRPVVVTRVGGLPEVVADGRTGLVVDPGNPTALAGALGRLLADGALRARLGAAARDQARREHDWPVVAGRMAAVYAGAVRGGLASRL